MKRAHIFLALLLSAVAVPAYALPGFEAGARGIYWFPDLSADVKTTVGGVTGEFDAKTDLGVEDKNSAAGEAFLRIGNLHFRVGYMPLKFSGDKILTDNVVFNGRSYPVGSRVITDLDLKMLDGEIQYDFLNPDLVAADFNLGLILKVKYADGKVELAGDAGTETKDFKAPIPMVGLAAGVGILKDFLRVDARAAGMAYSGNHLYEGDAYASITPFPFIRLQGGYRIIDLAIDEDDIVAKVKLKGPYVGAQISF